MQLSPRGLRRASLALTLGVAGLATSASAASATPGVVFGNSSDGAYAVYHDDSSGAAPHISVVRGGTVLAEATGFSFSGGSFGGTTYPPSREAEVSLPNSGKLAAGDQLQVAVDGATKTFTYDGLPTISADACNGAKTFTGTVAAGATKLEAAAWMSGVGSADPRITATVAQSGTTYTVTLSNAVKTGDFVDIDSTTSQNGIDVISDTGTKVAATCPPPVPAPKPVIKAAALPLATQIVNGLQTTLGTEAALLAKLDIASLATHSAVNVPFTFLVPGTVTFTWTVSGAGTRSAVAAKAKKKAKALKIASGRKTSKVAGKAKVKMKLSKAGRKLLRHSKKLAVTFTATFTPAGGGATQKTHTKFTLKKHKKAKKH